MNETTLARMPSFELFAVSQEMDKIQNENFKLLTQLQELSETNRQLLEENGFFKKKYMTLQLDAEATRNMYTRLESQLFTNVGHLEELRRENSGLLRRLKEVEKETELEKVELEQERTLTSEKLAALQSQLRKLKMRSAPLPARNVESLEDSRNMTSKGSDDKVKENNTLNKTIKNQEKLIVGLQEELKKSQQVVHSSMARFQECTLQIASLENEKLQIKGVNQTLMEENESYQVLLHEKTMNGKFRLNPILQNHKDIDEEEDLSSLAKEILSVPTSPITPDFDTTYTIEKLRDDISTLRNENRVLKEENKALTLYINKILIRILESEEMEKVLSSDYIAPTAAVESEKSRLKNNDAQTGPSSEGNSELREGHQEQCPRTRRSNSLSQNTMTSGIKVAGGIRAAWKRMSVGAWKASPATLPSGSENNLTE